MKALYVASTRSYAGKSLFSVGLGLALARKGMRVGYFKPLGSLPVAAEGGTVDQDALLIREILDLKEPAKLLSPVVLSEDLNACAYEGKVTGLGQKVKDAFEKVAAGKDLVLVGGWGTLDHGAYLGIEGYQLVKDLQAKVILIERSDPGVSAESIFSISVDCLLAEKERLGEALMGVVINDVPSELIPSLRKRLLPFLERNKIRVVGVLPHDTLLASVSVRELQNRLGGTVLCCQDRLDEMVERFSVGAMNVESALRYFRRAPGKAVITGGDRADIQLAALETPTRCIILTGDLHPSDLIVARAEERHVPLLVVKGDTLETVARVEQVMGRLEMGDRRKAERARDLISSECDVGYICKSLGLKE